MKKQKEFSVCMSVYYGDNAVYFQEALASMYGQIRQPDEIVLVVDNPVGEEINKIIADFEGQYGTFHVVRLEKNSGHGKTRQTALLLRTEARGF